MESKEWDIHCQIWMSDMLVTRVTYYLKLAICFKIYIYQLYCNALNGQEFAGSGNNMKSLKIMAIFLELFSMSK